MKVFLDDEGVAPEGWIQVHWPDEAIRLLQSGVVTHLSLDHDLGDDQQGTGYDVLLWIEQEVALSRFIPPASMRCIQPIPLAGNACLLRLNRS
jgi:hypothetical protein